MQHSHTVVPAQPGFNTIEVVYDGASPSSYQLSPVIAWLVETFADSPDESPEAFPTPITVDGSQGRAAVVQPDGSVSSGYGDTWLSVPAWFAAQGGGAA